MEYFDKNYIRISDILSSHGFSSVVIIYYLSIFFKQYIKYYIIIMLP